MMKTVIAVGALLAMGCSTAALAQSGGLPTNINAGVARVGSGVALTQAEQQALVQQVANPANANPTNSGRAPVAQARTAPTPMPSPLLGVSLANEALDKTAPLSADEVLMFRKSLEIRQRALTENISGRPPARPTTGIHNIDLSPGTTPPTVRIEVGQGSIISFMDAAGRPWPAKVADNYSPAQITLTQFTEHQLSVSALSSNPIKVGIVVALEGVATAVPITVISGQTEVDVQMNMVMPLYLKGAPPGVGSLRGEPSLTAGDLMSYLLRTPPANARALVVEGLTGALAWQISPDRMVLRTNATVTTGAFRVQGIGDGTFAYEMPLSPQVRVVQADRFSAVRISGFMVGGK